MKLINFTLVIIIFLGVLHQATPQPAISTAPSANFLPYVTNLEGIAGSSAQSTQWGYMAWQLLKLKNGTNSTNTTYAGTPTPWLLTLLSTSAAKVQTAPQRVVHALTSTALILGASAILSGFVPSSWGVLLVIIAGLSQQVSAQAPGIINNLQIHISSSSATMASLFSHFKILEAKKRTGHSAWWCLSTFGTYCDEYGFVRRPKPRSWSECAGGRDGWCHCERVVDKILENPFYVNPNSGMGYMSWESLKLKNNTNSTNATSSQLPAPALVLHHSATHTQPTLKYSLLILPLGVILGLTSPSLSIFLIIVAGLLHQVSAQSTQWAYMAWKSFKDKKPTMSTNSINSTNTAFSGVPASLPVWFPSAASATQSHAVYAVIS